jgi:tetratricopeptide (TPR) repeat protein
MHTSVTMRINYILYSFFLITHITIAQKTSADYLKLGEGCSWDNDSSADRAIFYYTKAIELDSNCFECYTKRALRKQDKEPEGAFADYKKALEFDSTCLECYDGIADYYNFIAKDHKTSKQYLFRALKILDFKSNLFYLEQSRIISSIGYTYFLELGGNDIGSIKSSHVKLAIWDSLIIDEPLTR